MKKTEKSQRNFVAYEYKEVSANSSQASFLLDGYENFGWEPDDNLPQSSQSRHPIGTAFIACSTFAVTADPPKILLCIIFAIPGFLGWILPYFLYKKIVRNQTEKLTPMIEAKYDEIYEICEKGNKLLY